MRAGRRLRQHPAGAERALRGLDVDAVRSTELRLAYNGVAGDAVPLQRRAACVVERARAGRPPRARRSVSAAAGRAAHEQRVAPVASSRGIVRPQRSARAAIASRSRAGQLPVDGHAPGRGPHAVDWSLAATSSSWPWPCLGHGRGLTPHVSLGAGPTVASLGAAVITRLVRGVFECSTCPEQARPGSDPVVRARCALGANSAGAGRGYAPAQPGGRFSRNARRPSWPSALVRCAAMRRAVSVGRERGAGELLRRPRGLRAGRAQLAEHRARRPRRDPPRPRARGRCAAPPRREPLAGDEVAARRRGPIFASANGEITAGTIPSFTSLNANCASGSAIDDVAAGDEPAAAAERVPLHARHDRRRAAVDRVEHRTQPQRVGDVLVEAEVDRRAHPLDVGACRERRPVAASAPRRAHRRRRRTLRSARRSAPHRTRFAVRAAPSRRAARRRRARRAASALTFEREPEPRRAAARPTPTPRGRTPRRSSGSLPISSRARDGSACSDASRDSKT